MTMKLEQLPAVEPHWPYGTVAQFYIKRGAAVKAIGVRELAVLDVIEIEGGYRITAGSMQNQYDVNDRQFVFEVDETGESVECVPWDDDMEQEFNSVHRRYTEAPGTKPIRVSEPSYGDGPIYPPSSWTLKKVEAAVVAGDNSR